MLKISHKQFVICLEFWGINILAYAFKCVQVLQGRKGVLFPALLFYTNLCQVKRQNPRGRGAP